MTDKLDSLLRAVRGEARREERARLIEVLQVKARQDGEDAARFSKRPGVTGQGRRAAHLTYAAQLLDEAGVSCWADGPGEHYATIANDCDSVELYTYDPDPASVPEGEVEPMPIRLVASDGAEGTVAALFLTIEDAEALVIAVNAAVARVQAARADRLAQSP